MAVENLLLVVIKAMQVQMLEMVMEMLAVLFVVV